MFIGRTNLNRPPLLICCSGDAYRSLQDSKIFASLCCAFMDAQDNTAKPYFQAERLTRHLTQQKVSMLVQLQAELSQKLLDSTDYPHNQFQRREARISKIKAELS